MTLPEDGDGLILAAVEVGDSPNIPPSRADGSDVTTLSPPHDIHLVQVLPASQFTFAELTEAYNQARVDYIVPMPMNVARLREYVHNYDVDIDASAVAVEEGQILGLAMLGVRPGHTWITRLGILPVKRRRGTGQLLMEHLIAQSRRLQRDYILLEVIKNNMPAYRLFQKLGFREIRELLVLRRPPNPPSDSVPPYSAQTLDHAQAVALLHQRRNIPSWLDETASLENAGNLAALCVELKTGDRGWLVYQNTVFQLGRLVLQTEVGDPQQVALALVHALHTRHPAQDTKTENFPLADPHWPALQAMGYLESFRRIEMRLDL